MKAKLLIITMFFCTLLSAAPLHGQISVSFKNVPLTEALATLENKKRIQLFLQQRASGQGCTRKH